MNKAIHEGATVCAHCKQAIETGERWEYYSNDSATTPEPERRRIHSRCVAQLLRDVISKLAALPPEQQDDFYIEI